MVVLLTRITPWSGTRGSLHPAVARAIGHPVEAEARIWVTGC